MPTLAELRAEPWWDREIVTAELDWLGDEICRRTGRPRTAAGTKGNEAHLRGAHRSQEWILNSRYCSNRSYTVQSGLTPEQLRHIAGFDFTPGAWGTAENRRLMVEHTRRLVAAMKAGQLDGVREVIGTLDGRTVVGTRADGTTFSSDDSHLEHEHLTFDRRRLTDRALMERIVAVALGEDTDMDVTQDALLYNASSLSAAIARGSTTAPTKRLADGKPGETITIYPTAALKTLTAQVAELGAAAKADEVRDQAVLAAVQALATAGGVDAAPILAAIAEVRAEAEARFAELLGEVATLTAERDNLRRRLAAAARAEADSLAAEPS